MAVELRIKGAEDFARLAKRLHEIGDKNARRGLQQELYKALNRAAKPARAAIKPNIRAKLPHKGGAGAFIARDVTVSQSNRGRGDTPRVVISSKSSHDIRAINGGELRHPVFGNRKAAWAVTDVEHDIFTEPIESRAPEIRQEMVKIIKEMAARIERGH